MNRVKANYYNPLAKKEELSKGYFDEEHYPLEPLHYSIDYTFINSILESMNRYRGTSKITGWGVLSNKFFKNGWFGAISAITTYSIIRKVKPISIIEIGSGYSTLVMLKAIDDGSLKTEINCISPEFPKDIVDLSESRKDLNLYKGNVREILYPKQALSWIKDIKAELGKVIVFIDSTHCFRAGGELNYLLFSLLEKFPSGTLIHFHDIFIPYEYPKEWVLKKKRAWNEQYVLYAFLYDNLRFHTVFPQRFVEEKKKLELKDILGDKLTSFPYNYYSESFWIEVL